MRTCILITDFNQTEIFEEFFIENDITEIVNIKAKSVKKNFFLDLLNLSDQPKSLFLFMAKETYIKKLETLCNDVLIDRHSGVFIKMKREKDMSKEKELPKKPKNSKLIVTILKSGFTELVLDVAKTYEISGATILNAKGIGRAHSSFIGIDVDSEREVVLIATTEEIEKKLQTDIKKALIKNKPVNGISFSLPLEDFIKFNEQK